MTKRTSILFYFFILLVLTSCSHQAKTSELPNNNDISVTESISKAPTQELLGPESQSDKSNDVDLDLTQLSSTMIFSEVYHMMSSPEDYLGKTIKISGEFYAYEGDPQIKDAPPYYFAVIIADETACCQQGLEFKWEGEHHFPDDYPNQGAIITITGIFDKYQENGDTYYFLHTTKLSTKPKL